MKNKLNSNNIISVYHYAGTYELHFKMDNKNVYLKNIEKKHHPKAEFDDWYFYDDDLIEEIFRNADNKDIEIMEIIE